MGDREDWRLEARCRGEGELTVLFFPQGDPGDPGDPVWTLPRAICNACPSRVECLEFALNTRQDDGMWGGTTRRERNRILRRRRRHAS